MYRRKTQQRSFPGPQDVLRHTLPNGITLLVRENFASPAVIVSGYVQAGAEDVPATAAGLAGFATDVMERGTHRRSFAQLYEEVESVGASFGISGSTHLTSFGAKGLAESMPLLLDILNDVLRRPAWRPEQVEKARAEIFTAFQERAHSTAQMASLLFYELAYPEAHPYHWSTLGYPETIAPLTADDLAQFHARHFAPQGMALVVVGAVKAEDVVQAVAATLGDWEGTRPPRAPLPPVSPLAERRERRLAIPDKTQSNVILGWPGPERLHPDFIPCFVANTVLGVFGMYGRLGKSVRMENGLAYYAYSSLDGGAGPGPWEVVAGVNPANVERVVDLALAELRRLREDLVPAAELEDVKSYLTGSLPLQLETNEGVARALLNIERYHLGLDYLQKYRDMIMAITAAQVREATRRWLDPEHFVLAVVNPEAPGDADDGR